MNIFTYNTHFTIPLYLQQQLHIAYIKDYSTIVYWYCETRDNYMSIYVLISILIKIWRLIK